MRDRLVCGLRSESTQKRLLSEADLTLARAVEIAQSMEAAHKNAQALNGPELPVRRLEKLPRERGQVERRSRRKETLLPLWSRAFTARVWLQGSHLL